MKWEEPIAFLIKRMPYASTFGDACLDAGGGYSIELKFWWHLEFPEAVVRRTLKHLPNNRDKKLISINVLEFVIVIINYCAALTVIMLENPTDDPFPILLNAVDNTSAHSWTTHTCKSSHLGKLLARFFCFLLIGSTLGINSTWISTIVNLIAGKISGPMHVRGWPRGCTHGWPNCWLDGSPSGWPNGWPLLSKWLA